MKREEGGPEVGPEGGPNLSWPRTTALASSAKRSHRHPSSTPLCVRGSAAPSTWKRHSLGDRAGEHCLQLRRTSLTLGPLWSDCKRNLSSWSGCCATERWTRPSKRARHW